MDVPPPVLVTSRLRLTPLAEADLPPLLLQWNTPEVGRFLWDGLAVSAPTAAAVREASDRSFSTAGYGLQQHLASEEIAQRMGAKFTHVAYRGGGTAMNDLVAARLDFGGFLAGTTKPLIAGGQLKGLAIVADKRSELVPDIPSTAEQGLPGMNSHGVHFMMFAPAATPKPLIATMSAELRKIVGGPTLKQRFAGIGFDPTPLTADEVAAAMRKTEADLAPTVKRLNIKLD